MLVLVLEQERALGPVLVSVDAEDAVTARVASRPDCLSSPSARAVHRWEARARIRVDAHMRRMCMHMYMDAGA